MVTVSHCKQADGSHHLTFDEAGGGVGAPRLAITGRVWTTVKEQFPALVPRLLLRTVVWARMSPDQKAGLVEALQELGYVAAMCGDGANDCGALKVRLPPLHPWSPGRPCWGLLVGGRGERGGSLHLRRGQHLLHPQVPHLPSDSTFPSLVREGRCALVTSFGVFKYMALYSMIQFASVLILYTNKTNLGDTQFLYIDLVITTTVAVLMGRTGPWSSLSPSRPPGSLVTGPTLASIAGQVAASAGGQLLATTYLHSRPWWSPLHPLTPEEEIVVSYDTTTVFMVSAYQYLSLAAVFSTGRPHRSPFYTNHLFLAALVTLAVATALLLLGPLTPSTTLADLAHFFQLDLPFPTQPGALPFHYVILAIVVVSNCTCTQIPPKPAPTCTNTQVNTLTNMLVEVVVSSGRWVKTLSHFLTRKKGPRLGLGTKMLSPKNVQEQVQAGDEGAGGGGGQGGRGLAKVRLPSKKPPSMMTGTLVVQVAAVLL